MEFKPNENDKKFRLKQQYAVVVGNLPPVTDEDDRKDRKKSNINAIKKSLNYKSLF